MTNESKCERGRDAQAWFNLTQTDTILKPVVDPDLEVKVGVYLIHTLR